MLQASDTAHRNFASQPIVPDVRKIAVLRANAIGDFVFALPALAGLRAAYPRAEIVYLGQRWHQTFLAGRSGPIDRVIVVPPTRGVNDEAAPVEPGAREGFFAAMRQEHFDLALQLHGGGANSNPFVRGLGARVSAGTKSRDAEPPDRWIPYVYFQQEIARWIEVVGLVGAVCADREPHLAVTPADCDEAKRAVPVDGSPLVVLHVGAGDRRRRWAPEKFAAVGDALVARGARVVVNGVGSERECVDAVIAAMRAPAVRLCGELTLGGFVGLLARARLLVGNDSGPLHLAAAVGVPTVGIYWCFNALTAGPITRAWHYPAISWRLRCPVCDAQYPEARCDCRASFVADIPVSEVLDAALDLYDRYDRGCATSLRAPGALSHDDWPEHTHGQ